MKKLIILLLTAIPFSGLISQNYVPNSSFEIRNGCAGCNYPPLITDEVTLACPPWKTYRGSADLYDPCGNWCTDIPNNNFGTQMPHGGLRYAGIGHFIYDPAGGRYEYLGTPLLAALAVGQEYHVEYWVSKAEFADRASNKLGTIFLNKGYDAIDSAFYMPERAHVYTDSIITDETGWTKVEGSFVADSAYTHMAIGYMFTNSQYVSGLGDSLTFPLCYYYIDDVCVIPVGGDCSLALSAAQPQQSTVLGVFPNPIIKSQSAILHFSTESNVEVYDLVGQSIRHFENVVELDVTDWPAGVYFLKEGNGSVMKLVVIE